MYGACDDSCIILLLGNVNGYQRRALGQSTPRHRHPASFGFSYG